MQIQDQVVADKSARTIAELNRVALHLGLVDDTLSRLDVLGVERILLPIHRASIPAMRARIQRLIEQRTPPPPPTPPKLTDPTQPVASNPYLPPAYVAQLNALNALTDPPNDLEVALP